MISTGPMIHCNNPFCRCEWPAKSGKKTDSGAWQCLRCGNCWYEVPIPPMAMPHTVAASV